MLQNGLFNNYYKLMSVQIIILIECNYMAKVHLKINIDKQTFWTTIQFL